MTQTNNEREAFELAEWVEYLADCELQNAKAMPAGHLQAIPRGHAENFKKIAGLLRQSPISQSEQQEVVGTLRINENGEYDYSLPYAIDSHEAYLSFVERVGFGEHKIFTSPPKQAIPEGFALININELNKIVGDLQGNDCFAEEVLSAVLDYVDTNAAPTNTEVGE